MTFFQGIIYVMRHAWLWPPLFWLRPLEVMGGDGFSISQEGRLSQILIRFQLLQHKVSDVRTGDPSGGDPCKIGEYPILSCQRSIG